MNKGMTCSRVWFLLLLLTTFIAGCGEHNAVPQSSENAVTAFSLNGSTGVVDETAKTISVSRPSGTSVTALVATFATTGSTTSVAGVSQTSGITPNNFTSPLAYTVTAANGSTSVYTVTVTVGQASAKALTSFSIGAVNGTIDETAKTIALTLPATANVSSQIASFATSGSKVEVAGAQQTSGTTPNNFSAPVLYTVTASNATTAIYTVTVTVAPTSAKAMTSYSLLGVTGVINQNTKTVAISLPSGTVLTALKANFLTTGTAVKVGSTLQASGTTPNNFSAPVVYTVSAADATTALYTVTVTVLAAKGPTTVDLGTAGNYVILAKSAITNSPISAITGDIGLSPAAMSDLTGFSHTMVGSTSATSSQVTGSLFAGDMTAPTSTKLTVAVNDMNTAYTDAAGRPTPDFTDLGTGEIGGQTLVPGLYNWTTGVTVSSDVVLTGGPNDVWIFQTAGTLQVSSAKRVTLTGGAQAKNVFWQVAGATTIGTTAHFEGILLCKTAITFQTGASMTGRALAQTAVALDGNAVTKPN
jgi:hypothetical protein